MAAVRGTLIQEAPGEQELGAAGFPRVQSAAHADLDPPFDWRDLTGADGFDLLRPEEFAVFAPGPPAVGFGRARMGFNAVKLGEYEGYGRYSNSTYKFGPLTELLDDLEALGAQVLRQTGRMDLTWPEGLDVAVDPAQIQTDLEGVITPLLTDLFRQLCGVEGGERDLQVVFTFLHATNAATDVGADPQGEMDEDSVVRLPFSRDHQRNVDADGQTIFDLDGGASVDAGRVDWALGTLDPRSPYKRAYVGHIAEAMGRILVDLASSFAADHGVDIWAKIAGIEIFNEVDRKNLFRAVVGGPEGWSKLVVAAVDGLCRVIPAEVFPALWAPSLSSHAAPFYFEVPAGPAKGLTLEFDTAAIREVGEGLHAEGVPQNLRVFSNQDLHFYHFRNDGMRGIHAARFSHEIEKVAAACRSGGLLGTVSICETGASSATALDSKGMLTTLPSQVSGDYPYARAAANGGDPVVTERFQAREVYRRLATALAAGAPFVGWNTHVASAKRGGANEFEHTGLRRDEDLDDDFTTAASYEARVAPKLGWFAYQRLASFLLDGSGVGVAAGEVLYSAPQIRDVYRREEPVEGLADLTHLLVILHFVDTARAAHVYVLFLDPIGERTAVGPVYVGLPEGARVNPHLPPPVIAEQHASLPVSVGDPLDGGSFFPTADADFGVSTEVSFGDALALAVDGDPVLLTSERELGFYGTRGTSSSVLDDPFTHRARWERQGRLSRPSTFDFAAAR